MDTASLSLSGNLNVEDLSRGLRCAILSKRRRRGQKDVGSMRNIRCDVERNCFGQEGRFKALSGVRWKESGLKARNWGKTGRRKDE